MVDDLAGGHCAWYSIGIQIKDVAHEHHIKKYIRWG